MPNTASAKKRLRQNVVRRARNRAVKSSIRDHVKKVIAAVNDGNIDTAEQVCREAAKRLDRAGARNIIHPNAASRRKSRLQRLLKKAKQSASDNAAPSA